MSRSALVAVLSPFVLTLAACSASESTNDPAPVAAPAVGTDAYSVRVKGRTPGVTGHFDCDDFGEICTCVGDVACNEMFEDLPCNTLNSWCNQDMDKCFCDLGGGSYKDYQ